LQVARVVAKFVAALLIIFQVPTKLFSALYSAKILARSAESFFPCIIAIIKFMIIL